MYVLSNGRSYIGVSVDNVATSVSNIKKALLFSEEKKAFNYRDNLKSTLRKFDWQIVRIEDNGCEHDTNNINCKTYTYIETDLEKNEFDISKFFKETIITISQLRDYASNMDYLEQECNKKILDVRHYIRDKTIKLNAIQMQRIGYYLQQLERERYKYKSNRLIAEIFLSDLNRIENINYIEVIKNIKESDYKPEILSYELLNEIVGKKIG